MKSRFLFIVAIWFLCCASRLLAGESVRVDGEFERVKIVPRMEFIEDATGGMTLDEAIRSGDWRSSGADSFNFGFTKSAYWFRFSVEWRPGAPRILFLELSYPLFNSVELYAPSDRGYLPPVRLGKDFPFRHRKIVDKNFIFEIDNERTDTRTYYMRIRTESSLNFFATLMTRDAYLAGIQRTLPVIWIYYGLMIIMVVYNLFIFFASRDRSYLLYVLFIGSYILFQLSLNGYSFQYLWPEALWWSAHAIPFFISTSILLVAVFIRDVLEIRRLSKNLNRLYLFVLFPVPAIWAVMSLVVEYALAIKGATVMVGMLTAGIFFSVLIALLRKSRPARFITGAFFGITLGILAYVLKTFGVLPEMFITEWGVQIGSSLVVVILSLALADKINTMRREMKDLLDEQKENERIARDRAAYLEGIVGTATGLTREFIQVSDRLGEVAHNFSGLSMEQAATSEEMSSTFEELTASVETIYRSTMMQKEEGEKSKELVEELSAAQKGLIVQSQKVEENIRGILTSAREAGESLTGMTGMMNIINAGGKEITTFIAMIDDISDRINLLSLNAAIEAARAGDYGKGFAVVADEIGKLAQATSDNSKQISRQISKIISDIDEGTRIVNATRASTDGIFSMVNEVGRGVDSVRDLMTKQSRALDLVIRQAEVIDRMSKEIVASTNEQNNSMEQTIRTISRLSEMAQEIAQGNTLIINFSNVIHEKAIELDGVIRVSE